MAKHPEPYHAFSSNYNGLTYRIITDVFLSDAFDPRQPPHDLKQIQTKALWDTGATKSVITSDVVQRLGIKPSGSSKVNHGGGSSDVYTYVINVGLPNKLIIPTVIAAELPDVQDDFGFIIGMDIISLGDFALTNFSGRSCLSFRIPSMGKIDYVTDWTAQMKSALGPNNPCFCGSGRKFKKCCLGKV